MVCRAGTSRSPLRSSPITNNHKVHCKRTLILLHGTKQNSKHIELGGRYTGIKNGGSSLKTEVVVVKHLDSCSEEIRGSLSDGKTFSHWDVLHLYSRTQRVIIWPAYCGDFPWDLETLDASIVLLSLVEPSSWWIRIARKITRDFLKKLLDFFPLTRHKVPKAMLFPIKLSRQSLWFTIS